jgi:hypothetical protein
LGAIVAEKYGQGFDKELILQIAALNGIANPNLIRADQTLTLPPLGSELLAFAPVTAELRSALNQTSGDGVALEQTARPAGNVSPEQTQAALVNIEAIAQQVSSGDTEAAPD